MIRKPTDLFLLLEGLDAGDVLFPAKSLFIGNKIISADEGSMVRDFAPYATHLTQHAIFLVDGKAHAS